MTQTLWLQVDLLTTPVCYGQAPGPVGVSRYMLYLPKPLRLALHSSIPAADILHSLKFLSSPTRHVLTLPTAWNLPQYFLTLLVYSNHLPITVARVAPASAPAFPSEFTKGRGCIRQKDESQLPQVRVLWGQGQEFECV